MGMATHTVNVEPLAAKAAAFRARATKLSQCIADFEKWLNTLPGRTQIEFAGRDIILQVKKSGSQRQWTVLYKDGEEYRPLVDAPISVKMLAIPQFNDLLLAMEQEQQRLIERMDEIVRNFDETFGELLKEDRR